MSEDLIKTIITYRTLRDRLIVLHKNYFIPPIHIRKLHKTLWGLVERVNKKCLTQNSDVVHWANLSIPFVGWSLPQLVRYKRAYVHERQTKMQRPPPVIQLARSSNLRYCCERSFALELYWLRKSLLDDFSSLQFLDPGDSQLHNLPDNEVVLEVTVSDILRPGLEKHGMMIYQYGEELWDGTILPPPLSFVFFSPRSCVSIRSRTTSFILVNWDGNYVFFSCCSTNEKKLCAQGGFTTNRIDVLYQTLMEFFEKNNESVPDLFIETSYILIGINHEKI